MTAGQTHNALDGEVSSFSLLDLHAHIGQSPGTVCAPRVAWGHQKDGAHLACLPQSFPSTTVWGLLPRMDPRLCCAYTPSTPSAINHALPKHLLEKMISSLAKNISSPKPHNLPRQHWRAITSFSYSFIATERVKSQPVLPAPLLALGKKGYEKDRESFGRALTW